MWLEDDNFPFKAHENAKENVCNNNTFKRTPLFLSLSLTL